MPNLRETLAYEPVELTFGTSGLRALVTDMTDLECYINTAGFLRFLAQTQGLPAGEMVYVAGDLRDSTPRITRAVVQAVRDGGYEVEYCGLIPTPAVSLYGFTHGCPSIMVTGSHIPADRNGIKFIKPHDELLKDDEGGVKAAVAEVRAEVYARTAEGAQFDERGSLREEVALPVETRAARELYEKRFTDVFDGQTLAGKKIVFYQHSAVGRDLLVELLGRLGAEVVPVGRSEVFIPIDSENVKAADQAYFRQLAGDHPDAFAIVSTDGDSDRPFVIDERGEFHRGDMLGVVVAEWLGADFAAYPVSASDAADAHLRSRGIAVEHTRIGSPYVVSAMKAGAADGKVRLTGWEVNGGFMTGAAFEVNGTSLGALPTRDAFLPIVVAMVAALKAGKSVSELFAALPQRYTQAGLINDFQVAVSKKIVEQADKLGPFFTAKDGFGAVRSVNTLDGVRIYFENGDIAHLRPSGNAPQLRIYGIAGTQKRADEIVALALAEPNGIFRTMEQAVMAG